VKPAPASARVVSLCVVSLYPTHVLSRLLSPHAMLGTQQPLQSLPYNSAAMAQQILTPGAMLGTRPYLALQIHVGQPTTEP
jgi:hypothetical protein